MTEPFSVAEVAAKLVASEVVTDGNPAAIEMLNCFATEVSGALSVTVKEGVLIATVVGVPEITPVEVFKVKPAGKVPAEFAQDVYVPVPPVACKAKEYGTPTCPAVIGDVVLIASVAAAVLNEAIGVLTVVPSGLVAVKLK